MAGILTKNTKLSYKATSSASTYTDLTNLQSLPSLGNGTPGTIDVTVLSDSQHQYISALKDNGGSSFDFTFLYAGTVSGSTGTVDPQFTALNALSGSINWQVTLPDGLKATFTGTPSVSLDEISVDAAITYTLSIVVDSDVTFA